MDCVEEPARPPVSTSILLQAAPDLAFCMWTLWHVASPCFLHCGGKKFFPLLRSLLFLPLHGRCCPFTAAVLVTSTMSKSWETTSKGNALKMRSPTSVQRNRLFWEQIVLEVWAGTGLLQLLREMLLYPELPSMQGDRYHIKKPSSSSVSSLFVLPLDSDMWFSRPQRPLLVYSNVRDQAHHLHLPKRIQFPHRFQITAEGKGCLAVSLSSTKEHGNKIPAVLGTFNNILKKNSVLSSCEGNNTPLSA